MQGKNIIGLYVNSLSTIFLGFLLLLPGFQLRAQHPSDTIAPGLLDQDLIQRLILAGIDSLRDSQGAPLMKLDSILIAAAADHATYLTQNSGASHHQPNFKKSTVNRRVEYYGGKGYLCGENIAVTYISELMEDKRNRRQYYNYTYQELATEFVRLWAQSEGHFQNATNPHYNLTGVFVMIHPLTNRATAVQVFAYKPPSPESGN